MDDLWFEDELAPDLESIEQLGQDAKISLEPLMREQLHQIHAYVRIHEPRIKLEDKKAKHSLPFIRSGCRIITVAIECEFDPGPKASILKAGFASAEMCVYVRSDEQPYPTIYQVIPENVDIDINPNAKVKVEPALKLPGDFGISIGTIEADLELSHIAPVTRGFKGDDAMNAYWRLENHRKAPLYGTRKFRLIIEVPSTIHRFYLISRAQGILETKLGPIQVVPKEKTIDNRPRFLVDLSGL